MVATLDREDHGAPEGVHCIWSATQMSFQGILFLPLESKLLILRHSLCLCLKLDDRSALVMLSCLTQITSEPLSGEFTTVSTHWRGSPSVVKQPLWHKAEARFCIKVPSYQCRKSHCREKTIIKSYCGYHLVSTAGFPILLRQQIYNRRALGYPFQGMDK